MADDRQTLIGDNDEFRDPAAAEAALAEAHQAELSQDRIAALDAYEKAFQADPDNPKACFSLAYHRDLIGDDEDAIHLYEQCCSSGQAHVNALLNLAVLYEDTGRYSKAERCLRLVLDTYPNHARAQLYLKDVRASREMYVDDLDPNRDMYDPLLETPVTDFALSARARNCLKKMNIRALGDLLRTSEAGLMAYKNFGETSLTEIKAMLAAKGLRLGQYIDAEQSRAREEMYDQLRGTGQENVVGVPIEQLDLSARAAKALTLLNIHTIGDLIQRTEAELLGIKNFGSTSLDEIKLKLEERGLSLRLLDDDETPEGAAEGVSGLLEEAIASMDAYVMEDDDANEAGPSEAELTDESSGPGELSDLSDPIDPVEPGEPEEK
ncbi:MAG: hypothetical protein CMJ49_04930 [Planctomycetaceae bacterium]|nr:hypothetical protein [Planctomycetaceae bacterium]